jgi:L-lactate dehydrogenase complex protein LldF
VYKNIGGHAYETTYSGPIGSVITPHLRGMHDFSHLSFASSLCGNCTEVCPVNINLHELLLENRRESVVAGESNFSEKFAWKIWKQASMNRRLMNQGTAPIKNWVVNKMLKGWSKQRAPIVFPKKTFNQLWKEAHKS